MCYFFIDQFMINTTNFESMKAVTKHLPTKYS